ncbi:MAG: hypothetical protein IPK06_04385 [Ignavibacteriae bacterium]|nr:hypothetical protein [Ignavibacteriota bacterium]
MEKLSGLLSSFSFKGTEVCGAKNTRFSESWSVKDVTDFCTSGDGKETINGRAERTIEVTGNLKYNNAVIEGNSGLMNLAFDSANVIPTDMTFEETATELNSTDGGTTGKGTETVAGFKERKSSITYYMKDTEDEPVRASTKAATLTFATSVNVAGNLRFDNLDIEDPNDGMIKVSLNGTWQGAPTQTNMGLPAGDTGAIAMTYKPGGTTAKAITGTGILLSKSVTLNFDGEMTFTYRFKFNGAILTPKYTS